MEQKIAYTIGPFHAVSKTKMRKNVTNAQAVALAYWKKGYTVICPHSNSGNFYGCLNETDVLVGYLNLIDLLASQDKDRPLTLIFIPGWGRSKGSIAEYARVINKNTVRIMLTEDELEEYRKIYLKDRVKLV